MRRPFIASSLELPPLLGQTGEWLCVYGMACSARTVCLKVAAGGPLGRNCRGATLCARGSRDVEKQATTGRRRLPLIAYAQRIAEELALQLDVDQNSET